MNIPEQELEEILSAAPRPRAPADLKNRLVATTHLLLPPGAGAPPGARSMPGWFAQWWPAVASAALSLFCGVILAVQQARIGALQESIRQLSETTESNPITLPPRDQTTTHDSETETATREQAEIERLRHEADALAETVNHLSQIQAENQKLRAQLAAAPSGGSFTIEEQQAMEKAREKALMLRCVNNLKQAGLAARTWELDHPDTYPPDVIAMSNELTTPIVLYCPADTNRQSAPNWASFSGANCSYEYLAPNGSPRDPSRILFRCPIHGNLGLCDGSVQMGVGKTHPDWIVQKDGKLYFKPQ
jgi:hypothetical protein